MGTEETITRIAEALRHLPAGKLQEAHDYVMSLKDRFGQPEPIDEGDTWSEEDLQDATAESFRYAEESVPWIEPPPGTGADHE